MYRGRPESVDTLTKLGRERLSRHFFMRDMLYSEIANLHGIQNIPDDPNLAVEAGKRLCEELLEPLHATFGHVSIRSAYRSIAVNEFGNSMQLKKKKGYNCAGTKENYSRHIWDKRDAEGCMGAMACIVIPWFVDRYKEGKGTPWQALAWWIHDHLPYSEMQFFPALAAFNLGWHERPARSIRSEIPPERRFLTKPGMPNHCGDHSSEYPGFPELRKT